MQMCIFTTGGTIDKVYFDEKSTYEVGKPRIGKILKEAQVGFDYRVVQLMRKDSIEVDDADRALVCAAVVAAPEQYCIVTHGTDSMTLTAEAVAAAGVADLGKTVVLTGALHPARFRTSDALFNIGLAIAAVQTCSPGVYVAMNGRIFPSGSVRKNRDKNRFETI